MYKRPGPLSLIVVCLPLVVLFGAAALGTGRASTPNAASVAAPPVSGLKLVPGDYPSLTAAAADLLANGVDGPVVLELQAGYTSTVETFPIVFGPVFGTSASNTITVVPAAGTSGLAIRSANAGPTIELDGAAFVVWDGRPGGVGTSRQLTLSNSNAAGSALRLVNDAHDNTVRYVVLRSANTSSTGGTVEFTVSAGGAGNDDNLIEQSDIADSAATPANAVYSAGSPGAQSNSGNTISGNYIYNFFRPASDSAGVRLVGGNTAWTISGNHFYQTAVRTTTAGVTVRGIGVSDPDGGGFTISGNLIGGSAPNAGGMKWQVAGGFPNRFEGISLAVGGETPSSVQGNRVTWMELTSSSSASTLPGVWSGIYVSGGNAGVGSVTGNVIGATTGTGSVIVNTTTTGAVTYGIAVAEDGVVTIANNTVGSITTNGSATVSHSLVGIWAQTGVSTIVSNTVGNSTTPNSLVANAQSSSATAQYLTGIHIVGATSIISENLVANLQNRYTGSAAQGQIRGIVALGGSNSILRNVVRGLVTNSANAGSGASAALIGILLTSDLEGQSVTSNTVHSGVVTPVSNAAVQVNGIVFSGPSTGSNLVAGNFVHSLKPDTAVSNPNANGALNAIWAQGGTATYANNMVRVGIDGLGTSIPGNPTISAIRDTSGAANRFYHNSLYVGGAHSTGASRTQAYLRTSTAATDFRDNLVVNVRTAGSGGATHYGLVVNDMAGFTSDFNGFWVTGPYLAGVGTSTLTTHATLAAWRLARGVDLHSFNGFPQFVNPTGAADSVNLHLNSPTPAESAGAAVPGVVIDFDGQARDGLTPVDVGADAGAFTPNDLSVPVILYEPLQDSGLQTTRAFTATITDRLGVPTSGNYVPRVYYRKNGGAWVSRAGTLDGGSGTNGTWSFEIDPADVGGVSEGDVVQYFVVAQDVAATPNIGSHPGSVVAANVLTISQYPGQLFAYTVLGPPTATPTATETATPSATPEPTATETSTATATPSATSSSTATATATNTATASPTATATDVPTSTSTATATLTATPSSTSTATASVTPSSTATASNTATASPTNSSTPSVTVTGTATLTETPEPTSTVTSSPTASSTSTATLTATQTPQPTAPPSTTRTATRTPTNTPEPTATGTATATASASATATRTSTPEPTLTPTANPSATPSPTLTSTPSPSPSGTATASPSATASASATVTLTPRPTSTRTSTITVTPSPTSTATASATSSPSSTVTRTATVTATATPTVFPSTTRTATSTPTQTGTVTATRTWTPTSTVAPSSTTTAAATGTSTGTSTSTSTPTSTNTPTPTLSATLTPTPCVPVFSDVAASDWFYTYVRYLFCEGVISG